MDKPACRVVYVHRNVDKDGLVPAKPARRDAAALPEPEPVLAEISNPAVHDDLQPLLGTFGSVHAVSSGGACLNAVFEPQQSSMYNAIPTLVIIDTPHDEKIPAALPTTPLAGAPSAEAFDIHTPDEQLYGLALLQKLITESHLRSMAKLIIPVPIISVAPAALAAAAAGASITASTDGAADEPSLRTLGGHRPLVRRCLDLGAVEVIMSPLNRMCISTLEIAAYKANRDASRDAQALREITAGRKRSWVGVSVGKEQKPYAYLREAMVSGLMNGICRVDQDDEQIVSAHIAVSAERQEQIAAAVGRWHFCAHSFTDDELLVAAMLMFKHALEMTELERWRISSDALIRFLVACRTAYNNFVPYHNFRHVVDVLQATFSFLVHIRVLPPYSAAHRQNLKREKSPIAALLSPFDALTLLVTAIGHDVGHPGVNNGFLTTLNAPLAQLYNDRSVLESFHCAAYSQILRRYWPATFEDRKMRNLLISSILATDMGLHFDYMKKLGDLQEKLQHNNNSTEGWNGRQLEDYRTLACSLLIKCADISNVARHHETACKWMYILSDEVARQAAMEEELDIKSSLMMPPKKDMISLGNAQLGFMNMFAIPLFQGVADIMPGMTYTIDELEANKTQFEAKLAAAKAAAQPDVADVRRSMQEGTMSPRTTSFIADKKADSQAPEAEAEGSTQRHGSDGVASNADTVKESIPDSAPLTEANSTSTIVQPASEASPSHLLSADHKEIYFLRGSDSSFEAVRQLADSDPFQVHHRGDSNPDKPTQARQRISETTDGSVSGTYGGDWASQATSGTGKVAVSPSTQGTSIVSNDSVDRTAGVSPLNMSPSSNKGCLASGVSLEQTTSEDVSSGTGSIGRAEGKSLKKRPSRFRIKEFPFFRRSKGTSPPFPAADATN